MAKNTQCSLTAQEVHLLRLVKEIGALVTKMKTAKSVDMAVLVEEYNVKISEIQGIHETVTPIEGLCNDLINTPAPENWKKLGLFFGDIESAFANYKI